MQEQLFEHSFSIFCLEKGKRAEHEYLTKRKITISLTESIHG